MIEKDEARQGEALEYYLKAAELDPTNSQRRQTALRLARAFGAKSEESLLNALKSVSQLHEVFPEDRDATFVLIGMLALSSKWQQAEQLLSEIVAREIGYPDLWTFSAIIKSGNLDNAVTVLERTEANERWRPLYVALKAIQSGSRQYLRRIAPEVREIATYFVTELAPELTEKSTERKSAKRR